VPLRIHRPPQPAAHVPDPPGRFGADAFSIKRIAGHSSVIISEKYIHPTPESLERAFERLEEYNAKSLPEGPKLLEAATVSATAVGLASEDESEVA